MQGIATIHHTALAHDDISISCYENEIPAFAAGALDSIYANIYSSLPYLSLYNSLDNLSTYVVREGGKIVTLFLFKRCDRRVEVLNKFFHTDAKEISRFASFIFKRYGSASMISFPTVAADLVKLPFPFRQATLTEDFVLKLPATVADYDASLGSSTRRTAKAGMRKLLAKYPSASVQFYSGDQIQERHLRRIAELYIARLEAQNVAYDPKIAERRVALAKQYPTIVGAITIDGELCAGSIMYRVGDNYFASMLAHDPSYNDDHIGFLCAYRTVCESIERGGREFHFGQTRFRYKENLRCVPRHMKCVEVYRSRLQLLMNLRTVARLAVKERIQQLELWLRSPQRRDKLFTRTAASSLLSVRRLYARLRHAPEPEVVPELPKATVSSLQEHRLAEQKRKVERPGNHG